MSLLSFAVKSQSAPDYRGSTRRAARRSTHQAVERLEGRTLLTSWFVSTSAGADTNPGTLALPLATIQKAATLAKAGDSVNIRAGVYHETVTPAHAGTATAPITYQAYNGESVTIDGADAITGWTLSSGSIYTALQPWDLGDGNNQVFAGTPSTQMLTDARWPNSGLDPMNVTTAIASKITATVATSGLSTATLTNAALTQPAGFWVGATIHIDPGAAWVWETGTVTASSPGSITFSYQQLTSYQVPGNGNQFYLTGALGALDAAGEFYHDPNSGTLSVWSPAGGVPTGVEAKHRLYAFELSNLSYINIQGLNLMASTIDTNASSSHIDINSIAASFVSNQLDNADTWNDKLAPHTTGIILNGTWNTLRNSYVGYSSGDGVALGGSNNTVQNCTINECDYAGYDEAAISILGSTDAALHNVISGTGRSGITFYFAAHTQILNNIIHDIGLRTTDAGAVYAWHTDGMGTEIGGNLIYNAFGGGYGNSGLFLDDNCSNITIDHNVVYNTDAALKMNGTSTNDAAYNNTLLAGTNPVRPYPAPIFGYPTALICGAAPKFVNSIIENDILIGRVTYAPGTVQYHNLFSATSAKFVNAAAFNFQLQAGSDRHRHGSGDSALYQRICRRRAGYRRV